MESHFPVIATYHEDDFAILRDTQDRHFWCKGRHRFVLTAVNRIIAKYLKGAIPPRCIDLGGGCGGWVSYFQKHKRVVLSELALSDASELALSHASETVDETVTRYKADVLNLEFTERWDVAFLLDVIEHLSDDTLALAQTAKALSKGGLLFVTVPAFQSLWSWNDDLIGHKRRYSKRDLKVLAEKTGYELLDSRYFMFFLSPFFVMSRFFSKPDLRDLNMADRSQLVKKMHEVPNGLLNGLLTKVFQAESPLGHYVQFPWGTS